MARIAAVAFDLDGVVWRDYAAIPGSVEVVLAVRSLGLRTGFLTNTSSRTPSYLAARLADVGLETAVEDVFCSARLTAQHLIDAGWRSAEILVVGAYEGLRETLTEYGMVPLDVLDPRALESSSARERPMVVGYQPEFSRAHATAVLRLAEQVSTLIAPERDRWYASTDGIKPGSGWVVAACEELLQRRATIVGKPSPYGLQAASRQWMCDPSEILVVGDSLDADIQAASRAGSWSCLFAPTDAPTPPGTSSVVPDFTITDLHQAMEVLDELRHR